MTTTWKRLLLATATLMLTALTLVGASSTARPDGASACPKASACDRPCEPCPDCPLSGCPKRAH